MGTTTAVPVPGSVFCPFPLGSQPLAHFFRFASESDDPSFPAFIFVRLAVSSRPTRFFFALIAESNI